MPPFGTQEASTFAAIWPLPSLSAETIAALYDDSGVDPARLVRPLPFPGLALLPGGPAFDKYNAPDAKLSYADVLKRAPEQPRALLGMARVP